MLVLDRSEKFKAFVQQLAADDFYWCVKEGRSVVIDGYAGTMERAITRCREAAAEYRACL